MKNIWYKSDVAQIRKRNSFYNKLSTPEKKAFNKYYKNNYFRLKNTKVQIYKDKPNIISEYKYKTIHKNKGILIIKVDHEELGKHIWPIYIFKKTDTLIITTSNPFESGNNDQVVLEYYHTANT
jgi:hypothetical protein